MNNQRKSGVILTYVNIFLNTFVMLFYTPFVLKYLGQSEFGLYSLAISILSYLVVFDFGFGNAVVVFTSKFLENNEKNKQKMLYGTIFSIYLLMSVLSIIIFTFLYFKVDVIFQNSMNLQEIEKIKIMLIILAGNIAISLPFNIFSSIITAYEKFIFLKVASIIRALSVPLVTIGVLLSGYQSIAMIVCVTVINLVFLFAEYIYCRKVLNISIDISKFNLVILKLAFSYSFFIFLSMVVDRVNWNMGQFIIGVYLGAKEVAVFAIAILFNTAFMMLSTAVSNVLLPKVVKMVYSGASSVTLTEEMTKVGRIQAYIIFMILFGFIIFGKQFIYLWAGEEYQDAYLMTIMIMLPLSIPLIQNVGLSILQAKNKFAFKAISSLISALIALGASVVFLSVYGSIGISFAIGLSFFLLNGVIMNVYYQKIIKIDILSFWMSIFQIIIPLGTLSFIFFAILGILEIGTKDYFLLSIFGFGFVVSYFLVSYSFIMNAYEKNILSSTMISVMQFKR